MRRPFFFLLSTLLYLPAVLMAQQVPVTGTVTDQTKNEALSGVSVQVKGTQRGTTTDSLGRFSITVPDRKAVLIFNYVGFAAQELSIPRQGAINVKLSTAAASMNEVVVVGYGTQKRKDITGSVASVDRQRMEDMPNTNFAQALEGALPGVSVTTKGGGAEGDNVGILVRGQKSIKASTTPLIIVDGIPYNGSISDITAVDIASMDVLKDASAAAIYGSRGSNGVIIITTKAGSKTGKPLITYKGYYGNSRVTNLPDILTPEQFYNFKVTREGQGAITTSEQAVYDSKKFPNWLDLATQTGQTQQHTIGIEGGGKNVKYYASGNFTDNKGVAVNDHFKRYATRINLEANITPWLTYGTRTQLSLANRSGLPVTFSADNGAYLFNPLTRAYDSTGKLTIYPWPDDIHFANPLQPTLAINTDNTYKVFSVNYAEVKLPLNGLTYRLNTGIEYQAHDVSTYYGRNTLDGLSNNGDYSSSNSIVSNYTVENILNYDHSFDKHSIGITGLYSYENDVTTSKTLNAQQFPSDVLTNYQTNVALAVQPNATYAKRTLISQMARINYSYDSRYMITLTGRRDGSSVFGANYKYGFFPSVAVGWNISNESFFKSNKVSNLKLRASYGKNGNQAIDPYATLAQLAARSYIDGIVTAPGYVPNTLDNPNLHWESTTSANIGVDFGLFHNRVQGTFDYYTSRTSDLLLDRQISPVEGIGTVTQNIGRTANHGFELGLGTVTARTRDFTWTTTANISINRNKILELYGDGKNDTLNRWFIGHPIDVDFGYVYNGVYQLSDDTAHSVQGGVHPGYAKIKDLNKDGTINSYDRTILGNHQPSFTWGMGNTFKYKQLSLYVFVQGVEGVSSVNTLLSDNGVQSGVRFNTVVKNWWTPTNPTNDFYANRLNANALGVQLVQNSSFIRVKDISLAYDFSARLLDKAKITKCKIYVETRNPFTFTKWVGLDPEIDSQTGTPLQKSYVIGLSLSL